jgi:predicted nucleotidyltransferase
MELPVALDDLRDALRRHGIVFALVFGSHAEGRARSDSDIDLAVWAPDRIDEWSLRSELPEAVDLTDIADAPEGLAGRIALTGVVVLDDDPPRRIRWQAETRKRYLDEAGRRERFRQDFTAAHG